MRPEPDQVIDFYQEWASAHNYWGGLPIYTPHSTSIPRYLGLVVNPVPAIEYNIHPPTSVLLILPLGRLNYATAVLVWNVISLVALGASLVIVALMLKVPASLILPGLTLLPLCHPIYGNLHQGQLNLVLVLLVTAMWALERTGRSTLAAMIIGVAAAIKLFPIYLVLYYVAQGRIRPVVVVFATFITLNLIALLLLGTDTYYDYVVVVLPWNAKFRMLGYNLSIAGLWHKLFYPVPAERIIPLWSSLALARWGTLLSNLSITVIVVLLTCQAKTSREHDMAFAAVAAAMLLVSPVTWDAALPILLVPFALIACSPVMAQSRLLMVTLFIILVISCMPQQVLTRLALGGQAVSEYSWMFMLGVPSLKFYMLLGTFVLAATIFRFETVNPRLKTVSSDLII